MKENRFHPKKNTFRELLNECSPSDFDGHTEFQRMTPEERLDALASLARFVYENKGKVEKPLFSDCFNRRANIK